MARHPYYALPNPLLYYAPQQPYCFFSPLLFLTQCQPVTPCSAGKELTGATTKRDGVCTPCSPGYKCDGSTKIACGPGKFASLGTSCSPCREKNEFSKNTANSVCETCLAGSHTSDDQTACTACPAGSFCPDGSTKRACKGSKYSSEKGTTECKKCDAGSYTNTQSVPENTRWGACCVGCINKVCKAANKLCTTCEPGFACDGKTQRLCGPGTYSGEGQASCSKCTGNRFSEGTKNRACKPCAAGSYTAGSSNTACTECPAGFACPNGSTKTACTAGKYSNSSSSSCAPCGSDSQYTKLPSGNSECSTCGAGFHTSTSRGTSRDLLVDDSPEL